MSQPKRYSFAVNDPWFGNGAYVAEDGKYVLYSDYAALAAENERRTEQLKLSMSMTDSCIENINRLTAENERLRKAGDAMLGTMLWAAAKNPEGPAEKRIEGWLAAKREADAS